jgi:uncharacterized protein YjbJ (UPF0337 family)
VGAGHEEMHRSGRAFRGLCPATNGKRVERRKHMGLLGSTSGKNEKDEGAMDRAKGRMKEAGGALTGDKKLKREGRSDQRKGRTKEKKGDLKDLLS